MYRIFALLLLLLSMSCFAMELPRQSAVPGGIVIVDLDIPRGVQPLVTLAGRKVFAFDGEKGWKAVVGIPLETPAGKVQLKSWYDGKAVLQAIEVQGKQYETQRITIKDKNKVEPSGKYLARITTEGKIKDTLRTGFTDTVPDMAFRLPVKGPVSSTFGLRRIFNGKPKRPHSGLDIAVAAGTAIKAPADATVVYVGEFFFDGNMVYLDHGSGLITNYAHMQKISVKAGQTVRQGDIIGTVGQTGRATGPHLHWGTYLNQVAVDPLLFINDSLPVDSE